MTLKQLALASCTSAQWLDACALLNIEHWDCCQGKCSAFVFIFLSVFFFPYFPFDFQRYFSLCRDIVFPMKQSEQCGMCQAESSWSRELHSVTLSVAFAVAWSAVQTSLWVVLIDETF